MTAVKRGIHWVGAILFVAAGMMSGQTSDAQALPDANGLVKKMLQAYRSATTVRDESKANIIEPNKGRYEQNSVLVYQKPNKLYLSSVDPNQGTIRTYSDGRLISVFSGKANLFTRRNAAADMPLTVTASEKAAQDAFRVSITQLLSPLAFLSSNGTMREAVSFRTVGTETVAGYKTYKVTAQANPQWLQGFMPSRGRVQFLKKDITLWIDVRRNLLIKASAQLAWKAFFPSDGISPGRTEPGALVFEEVHRSTVLNSAVKDEEFRFAPPKNAKEVFQERRN